jgi:hypothetical protein
MRSLEATVLEGLWTVGILVLKKNKTLLNLSYHSLRAQKKARSKKNWGMVIHVVGRKLL